MKLGILGTGMIVREFLPWLAGPDCPFTVQALCSTQRSAPVADEMCEQYGIPQHTTNYFELLQWVDVIYLAVPNLQHYRGEACHCGKAHGLHRCPDRGAGGVGPPQKGVPV